METILREILSNVKDEKPDGKKIDEVQKVFDLAEDVERLAGNRGMVGVQEAIQDGYFPKDVKDADFFAKLLSVPFSQDIQISLLEIFLAKYTYDNPAGWDAFIDYIYYQELKDPSVISSRERLEGYLRRMDNRSIQRMLREVQNNDLGVALKGCQPEMAKVVLENLSKMLRAMILEDMEFMGSVRETDIADAMDGMSDLTARQIEGKEIALLDEDVVKR